MAIFRQSRDLASVSDDADVEVYTTDFFHP